MIKTENNARHKAIELIRWYGTEIDQQRLTKKFIDMFFPYYGVLDLEEKLKSFILKQTKHFKIINPNEWLSNKCYINDTTLDYLILNIGINRIPTISPYQINITINKNFFEELDKLDNKFDEASFYGNTENTFNEYSLKNYSKIEINDFISLMLGIKEASIQSYKQMIMTHFDIANIADQTIKDLTNIKYTEQNFFDIIEIIVYMYWAYMAMSLNDIRITKSMSLLKNNQELNQSILDYSYDFAIQKLKKMYPADMFGADIKLEQEKECHIDLFTNNKRNAKVLNKSHYMDFLHNCTIHKVFSKNDGFFIFKEFAEGLIEGYSQYITLKRDLSTIRELEKDIAIFKKYNKRNDILEEKIQIMSLKKPLHILLPYKILASKLNMDTGKLYNYIQVTNRINKNAFINNFRIVPYPIYTKSYSIKEDISPLNLFKLKNELNDIELNFSIE